jgi:hypothetical protein
MSRKANRAALAGTRMLILEECFDALVDALIASGAIPVNAATVMLDHLADRFLDHAAGRLESDWQIHAGELQDQASRLRRAPNFQTEAAGVQRQ